MNQRPRPGQREPRPCNRPQPLASHWPVCSSYCSNASMLSPKEGLIRDRRQVLHFQPHCCEHWSQTLGVTVEELLVCFPMQPW